MRGGDRIEGDYQAGFRAMDGTKGAGRSDGLGFITWRVGRYLGSCVVFEIQDDAQQQVGVGRSLTTSELLRPAAARSLGEEWGSLLARIGGRDRAQWAAASSVASPNRPSASIETHLKIRYGYSGTVSVDKTAETSGITRCWHLEVALSAARPVGSEAKNGQARATPPPRFLSGHERKPERTYTAHTKTTVK